MQRDNTEIIGKLFLRGGQLSGITTDVSNVITGSANTEQTVSITFTPTENGVISLECHAYGGTTRNLWIKSISVA